MRNTVLITGGLGYVGGRIAHYLVKHSDYNVRITTRKVPDNVPVWLNKCDIVQVDLVSPDNLQAVCDGVRYILHLAGTNEIVSAASPETALMVTGLGTVKLLEAAERAGVERFIYFSTAHIYGAPLQGTITEQSLPRPVHPYAITHKVAEDFVLAAHDRKILSGMVLRLSNGFGAPMLPQVDRWTLLVNDLCRQAVTEKSLTLHSSGMQKRDFITLHDVCRIALHCIGLPGELCGDGLFNVGGELSMSIIDMARVIAERCSITLGFQSDINRPLQSANEGEYDLTYSIDKLKSTGFMLTGDIISEIDSTLLFCRRVFS